jgi:hypothetical protein
MRKSECGRQMTEGFECGIRNAECGIEEHRTEKQECGSRNVEDRGQRLSISDFRMRNAEW